MEDKGAGWRAISLTSVFNCRPLQKNIIDTAIYLTVISGRSGPVYRHSRQVGSEGDRRWVVRVTGGG